MAKILNITGGNASVAGTITSAFFPAFNSRVTSSTTSEATQQIPLRNVGVVFSSFYIRITANNVASISTGFKLRIAGTNGTLIIAAPNSTTGEFQDVTHSDPVRINSSGTLINYSYTSGGGQAGSRTYSYLSLIEDVRYGDNTIGYAPVTVRLSAGLPLTDSGSGTTYYNSLSSSLTANTTEANAQTKIRTNGTLRNLFVYVSANSKAVTNTIGIRKNTANGNLVVSIGSTATGIFEDTTNTDTITSGDLLNYYITFGASASSITIDRIGVDFSGNQGVKKYMNMCGVNTGTAQSASTTSFYSLMGTFTASATESDKQLKTRIDLDISDLGCYISANATSSASTLTFKKDGSNTALTLSIGAGATGYFEDTADVVSFVNGNELGIVLVSGATSTITPTMISWHASTSLRSIRPGFIR